MLCQQRIMSFQLTFTLIALGLDCHSPSLKMCTSRCRAVSMTPSNKSRQEAFNQSEAKALLTDAHDPKDDKIQPDTFIPIQQSDSTCLCLMLYGSCMPWQEGDPTAQAKAKHNNDKAGTIGARTLDILTVNKWRKISSRTDMKLS